MPAFPLYLAPVSEGNISDKPVSPTDSGAAAQSSVLCSTFHKHRFYNVVA